MVGEFVILEKELVLLSLICKDIAIHIDALDLFVCRTIYGLQKRM